MWKKVILILFIFAVNAYANLQEVQDDHFSDMLEYYGIDDRGILWDVESFQDHILKKVFSTDDELFNQVLMVGQYHVGTPYVWGGYNWDKGVDCSHFTYKVYNDVDNGYGKYYTTKMMTQISENKYLVEVPKGKMMPGDLLVYGVTNPISKKWSGHVVILIDKAYESTHGFKGLAVGAHPDVGVQFVSYAGFPNYYKYPFYTLKKVLRVK